MYTLLMVDKNNDFHVMRTIYKEQAHQWFNESLLLCQSSLLIDARLNTLGYFNWV